MVTADSQLALCTLTIGQVLAKSLCHKGVNGFTASSESINGNVPFWARKSIRNRVGLAGNQGETGGKITELCSLVAAPGLARQICVDLPLGANAGGSQSEEPIEEPGSRRAIRLSARRRGSVAGDAVPGLVFRRRFWAWVVRKLAKNRVG